MKPKMRRVGIIRVKEVSVFKLDPDNGNPQATTVIVYPGYYPAYSYRGLFWWYLNGDLNERYYIDGDHETPHQPMGLGVQFLSPKYSARQLLALEADPAWSAKFELRFDLSEEVA